MQTNDPTRKAIMPKMDPDLVRQIEAAQKSGRDVEACFILKSPEGVEGLDSDETDQAVKEIIDRAAKVARSRPSVLEVFSNIRSFTIRAKPALIEEIAKQPEIDSGMANEG